jgi:O-antigen/teichoic acid export membrane protein
MSYASLLFSIPISVCNSLFAEGSANEQRIIEVTAKAIKLICVLLFPAIAVLLLFGKHALLFFGVEYANNSTFLLSTLALSSIFVSINTVCWTLLNLKHRVGEIMVALSLNAFLILTLTFLWTKHGLSGTGLAWIVGQGITSLVYFLFTFKYLRLGKLTFRGTQP